MDTKDLINIKKQRIREELEKVVPPGFHLFPHPKIRRDIYDNLDKFLGIDETFARQVGYLTATDKGYDIAIQNLRFFGIELKDYKDVVNTGPFYNAPELNKNLEEACDYIIRFYNLAKIIIKRADEEVEVRLNVARIEKDKLSRESSQQKKAAKFVSGATKFRPGKTIAIRSGRIANIIPKTKAIPQELAEKISKPVESKNLEEPIEAPKRIVSVLGRLALDLEFISNNIDKTREAILEDYKNTREINKKEVEEYRKRVANRGRKIGRRELGDNKTSLKDIVKKYTGSFFSGAGGAIRALALFNMIEAFANGNPLKALGPLLGIGATYLPAIGQAVGGIIAGKVLGGLFKGGGPATKTAGSVMGGSKLSKLTKFGGKAALLGSGVALASQLFGMSQKDDNQQRLEDLTEQQKELVSPESLVPVPQDDLKKFEELNKRFEKALDFLLGKQKDQDRTIPEGSRSPSPPPTVSPGILPTADTQEAISLLKTIQQAEGSDYFTLFGGKKLSELTQMTLDEVIQMGNTGKLPSRFGGGDAGYKSGSRATGAYQFMPGTLEGLKSRLGLTGTETFDTALQDRLALSLVVGRGVDPNAPLTDEAIKKLSGVWAALPGNTYMFQGKRQTRYSFDQIKSMYQRNMEYVSSAPAEPTLSTQPQPRQTPRQYPNITVVPSPQTPTIVPFAAPTQQEPTPMSMSDEGNKIVNHVSTTYPENFLTLYSKLIYQIV